MWLKEGNRDSKFFHASTVANRRKNFIGAIKDDFGVWFETRSDIGNFLTKKFEVLPWRTHELLQLFG